MGRILFNQQVILQRDTAVLGSGQHIPNYTTVGTYFASVVPESGEETTNAQQLKGLRSYKITMRNIGTIRPTDRLIDVATNVTMNVQEVLRLDGLNGYLTIKAKELVSTQ